MSDRRGPAADGPLPTADRRALPVGAHLLVDLYAPPAALADGPRLTRALSAAVAASGLHPVAPPLLHRFAAGGAGVTGVALLAESHIAFHTYPEYGYAALDIFTCGEREPAAAAAAFAAAIGATRSVSTRLSRGRRPAPSAKMAGSNGK